jgi:hypothetical protein
LAYGLVDYSGLNTFYIHSLSFEDASGSHSGTDTH